MRGGGYVIYFRHGLTNWQEKLREQQMNTTNRFDHANCATQRNLSEQGRAEARMIRFALESAGVKISQVFASQFCRPAEHVQIITGKAPERVSWLTGLGRPETIPRLKERVATPPATGTNVVLGDHGDLIYNVTDWVIGEGDAVVFRPEPPGYAAIAWIRPHEWLEMAEALELQRAVKPALITGHLITGDNPLDATTTERVLAPFMGQPATLGNRYRAQEDLTGALRTHGYGVHAVALSEGAASATLRLAVMAGRIQSIKVVGQGNLTPEQIRTDLPALVAGDRLNSPLLARQLLAANENRGRTLNVILNRGAEPGTYDADVAVAERRAWQARLRADSSGDATTGRARVGVGVEHTNFLGLGHIGRAALVTSPEHFGVTRQSGLAYSVPIPALAGAFSGYWARSSVAAGVVDGVTEITGAGHFAGLKYRHQLNPSADYHSDLQLGIEDRSYAGFDGVPRVHSRPVAIAYTGHWEEQWVGWNYVVEWVQNLSGGPDGDSASYAAVRPNASANWNVIRARADWTRVLTYDLRLILRTRLQWARSPLIPGEQIGAGGALATWNGWPWGGVAAVRGFEERAVRGDSGVVTNVEFWSRQQFGQVLRFGGFFDWAYLHRDQAPLGVAPNETIASAGVAMRYRLGARIDARADFAHVLAGSPERRRGSNRLFAGVVLSY